MSIVKEFESNYLFDLKRIKKTLPLKAKTTITRFILSNESCYVVFENIANDGLIKLAEVFNL